jgi:hypothetical protein
MCLPSIMLKSHLPTNRHETVATSVDGRLGIKLPKTPFPRNYGTSLVRDADFSSRWKAIWVERLPLRSFLVKVLFGLAGSIDDPVVN